MLFSNEPIARFMNERFESSWEMLRPVAQVRIDFGNGRVLHRTLHGNIATHVCTADGQVCDILPGMYAPEVYRHRLAELEALARRLNREPLRERLVHLRAHHRARAQAVRNARAQENQSSTSAALRDPSKKQIERPLEHALAVRRPNQPWNRRGQQAAANAADIAVLAEDTRHNETARRLQIHEYLGNAAASTPQQLQRWLYREVLHTDLDDPYLGLGGVVFGDEQSQS